MAMDELLFLVFRYLWIIDPYMHFVVLAVIIPAAKAYWLWEIKWLLFWRNL